MGGYPVHRDGILAVSIHNSWGCPMDPQWDNGSGALRLRTRSTAQPVQLGQLGHPLMGQGHPLKKQESVCWGPPNQYGGALKTFETMKPPTQLYIYVYMYIYICIYIYISSTPPKHHFFAGSMCFLRWVNTHKHSGIHPYTMMPPGPCTVPCLVVAERVAVRTSRFQPRTAQTCTINWDL